MAAPSMDDGAKFGPKPTISLIQRIRKADKGKYAPIEPQNDTRNFVGAKS